MKLTILLFILLSCCKTTLDDSELSFAKANAETYLKSLQTYDTTITCKSNVDPFTTKVTVCKACNSHYVLLYINCRYDKYYSIDTIDDACILVNYERLGSSSKETNTKGK